MHQFSSTSFPDFLVQSPMVAGCLTESFLASFFLAKRFDGCKKKLQLFSIFSWNSSQESWPIEGYKLKLLPLFL